MNFYTFKRRVRKAAKLLSEGKFKSVGYKLKLAMKRPIIHTKFNITYLKLLHHYRSFIEEHKRKFSAENMRHGHEKIIWWFWLQGVDDAPEICKACLASLRHWYPEYRINALDQNNITDYVTFPEHINQKYEEGKISKAHYSDLLRLELLNKYGGAWFDSTVYVTGRKESEEWLRLPLFAFRDTQSLLWSVSPSWFIVSDAHNPIISLAHDLMFCYWEENDSLVNYFLIYMMFKIAVKAYPEEWKKVPVVYDPLERGHNDLLNVICDEYSEEKVKRIEEMSDIHKLTFKLDTQYYNPEGRPLSPSSVYSHLVSRYIPPA